MRLCGAAWPSMQQPDSSVPVFLEVSAEPLSLDRCVAAVADDAASKYRLIVQVKLGEG